MKRNTMKLVVALVCAFGLLAGIAPGDAPSQAWAKKKRQARSKLKDSARIPVGNSPVLGNPGAPVTIVMFTDLQCPFCDRAHKTVRKLQKQYPQNIRLVFKHYPLPFHKQAKEASRAVLAAREQGKFWEMGEVLFENFKSFRDNAGKMKSFTAKLAKPLGIKTKKFKKDYTRAKFDDVIEQDIKLGQKLGVRGTPAFFINGVRLVGAQPFQKFEVVYKEQLAAAEAMGGSTNTYAALVEANYKPYKPVKRQPRPEVSKFQYVPVVQGRDAISNTTDEHLVTIVEFSDLQCPFCDRAAQTVKKLQAIYGPKLRVVFKHNPLPFHKEAKRAAIAALSAKKQGKFWEYQEMVFKRQKELKTNPELLYEIANALKLDMKWFERGLNDPALARQVEDDMAQAKLLGARGTPSFFVNGKFVAGAIPLERFQGIIDKELRKAKTIQSKYKIRGEKLYLEAMNENIRQLAKQPKGAGQ